ncbi:hypothetical protein [Streptococcus loxodontisalivarius]|uniref:Phage protein n=1 Tax=Streptococcus loxodontisalivarius TaxID=1349415 RepID=A0ABS2PV16_9STRE|nr:hypothetical protein [Streptococcus loxodontisalivarius]MBM7643731.1 hypothetical protein [Streptococcus loxodontisalivarius]
MLNNYLKSLNTHDFAVASTLVYMILKDIAIKATSDKSKDSTNDSDVISKCLEALENTYIPSILREHPVEEYKAESKKLFENGKEDN